MRRAGRVKNCGSETKALPKFVCPLCSQSRWAHNQSPRIALTLEELPEIARYGVTGPTLIMLGNAFAAALAASEQAALRKFARA